MSRLSAYDAVVVGAGPNGLAAAIVLAQARRSVLLVEARDTVGGGMRTAELTLPGFHHDVCSAIHPLGAFSPFLRSLPLQEHGLEWIFTPAEAAHALDDGPPALLLRSLDDTARGLGADAEAYRALVGPFVERAQELLPELLKPLGPPRHPLLMARFGLKGVRSARGLAQSAFQGAAARGLIAGLAAHSILPMEYPFTASVALLFAVLGHAAGWPFPRGGSQRLADAMASYFRSLGGEIETGRPIASIEDLPGARVVLLDVSPRQLARIAARRLPDGYRRRLEAYRYGPAAFKLDLALDGPIPWKEAACARAATVHLGGTLDEVALSEGGLRQGRHAERPFVILAQQSLFDATRAPQGKHTVWAYCHVPHASDLDVSSRIEAQIERFAPGFRDLILSRHVISPAWLERYNANDVGGDIAGGDTALPQLLLRPMARLVPYATPDPGIYLCSSSTPPGGGVHGLCGQHAARVALRRAFA